MRKTGICILALSVAMGTGACGMMGNLQNTAQTETNAGDYLIDEVGDMMEGVQSETELDLVVPDEHPGEGMTEGADDLLQQAPAETEKTEGADALPVSPAETETEMSYGPLERPLKELISPREAAGENWAVAYEDLETGETRPMDEVNSPDTDSYHDWSSNSRWFVFSSRRDDGLFTRLYIAHIDENGRAGKPFMLPQRDPKDYYDGLFRSYNVPEFVTGPVSLDKRSAQKVINSPERVPFGFRWSD